jgi:hypothetical protein
MLYPLGQEDLAPTDRGGGRVKRPLLSPVSLSFSGAVGYGVIVLRLWLADDAGESKRVICPSCAPTPQYRTVIPFQVWHLIVE